MSSRSYALGIALFGLGLTACGGTPKTVQPGEVQTTAAQAPSEPTGPVTANQLPAGTPLTVRTVDALTSESATTGAKFGAVLAAPISTATGDIVVPSGTKLFGHVTEVQGGGPVKQPKLAIALDHMELGGRMVRVETTSVGAEGDRSGVVKKVGAGALIGTATGSVAGGAAVGGAAALLSRGNEIVIQPGTMIEVTLTQPASIH